MDITEMTTVDLHKLYFDLSDRSERGQFITYAMSKQYCDVREELAKRATEAFERVFALTLNDCKS